MSSKSKGLGDTISKITKATGIDKLAKKVLGDDCGCEERRNRLNKMFPYSRQMTEDEIKIYEEVNGRIQGDRILGKDQTIMVRLYNKVFNANKKPSSCGSCVKETLAKLKKVYQNSCNIKED